MLYKKQSKLMGNQFEFTVIAQNIPEAENYFEIAIAEIKRIEALLTTFSETSITHLINGNAGIAPVAVPIEVYGLIKRCQMISKLTQGAFDITYGSVDKRFWNFDVNMKALPNYEDAQKAVALINYQNIILDDALHTVFLANKGMRIGFGGIGKGYAAECAKRLLQQAGVKSGIINASGDLTAWGYQENNQPWTIGLADPNKIVPYLSTFEISNKAVATSGNYEKFAIINGKKYSHTINPKTGMPISGLKSVTIIADNAEIADALATPIAIMGADIGVDLINQLPNIACLIIDDDDAIYHSKNINLI